MPVTFKIKHGVNHMFEHSRACKRTFFCYMTDYEYCTAVLFCNARQGRCCLADLRYAAGCIVQFTVHHCLNRIDNKKTGFKTIDLAFNGIHARFRHYEQFRIDSAAHRTKLQLRF